MRGPPEPSYDECQEDHSTTSPFTTTTPSIPTTKVTTTQAATTITSTTTTRSTTSNPKTTTITLATSMTTSTTTTSTTTTPTTTTSTTTRITTVITTTKRTGDYVLMLLAGLSDSGRLSSVDIVDPFETNSNCLDPTNLDNDQEGMIAEMFEDSPLTCGGSNGENLKSCYTYSEGEWKLSNIELVRYFSLVLSLSNAGFIKLIIIYLDECL